MNAANTLWMGDIDPWIGESFIMNSFINCGFKPESVKLIIDKRKNKFHNFRLINFASLEEAKNALFNLNSKPIPKTNMFFKLNLIKNAENCYNVYVGNLPLFFNDILLFNFFKSKYQSVYYATVITEKGVSKGYGFVHFSEKEEYKKCLKEMNGFIFGGKKIRVKSKNNNWEQIKQFGDSSHIMNSKISNIGTEKSISLNEEKRDKPYSLISRFYSNDFQKQNIVKSVEVIESNNYIILHKKIKESVNKMIESLKNNKRIEEISPIILYYSSMSHHCFNQ